MRTSHYPRPGRFKPFVPSFAHKGCDVWYGALRSRVETELWILGVQWGKSKWWTGQVR